MSIDRMGNELAALGVSARDVRCLLLLPQIYVGWAIERRDVAALEALLDTTVRRAAFGADTFARARNWLFERPSRAQFQSGFALLRALRRAPERPTIASSDLLEAMLWACRAAQLDPQRGAVGSACGAVSVSVARALDELEAWLEIDIAELYGDLLGAEADEPAPPSLATPPSPAPATPLSSAPSPAPPASLASAPAAPLSPAPAAPFHPLSDAELERATALLEPSGDDERSEVMRRDDGAAPSSSPFPLLRRLA